MIKALILAHTCSLIFAAFAWVLQRDSDHKIGKNFPAPRIWLCLIILCFIPAIVSLLPFKSSVILPKIEIYEAISSQTSVGSPVNSLPLIFLAIYACLSLLLISRTLVYWLRLQSISATPTSEPDVYTSSSDLPPLTLSWPRRRVVVSPDFLHHCALIEHERTHLKHYDAELTLGLLLLQDVMLRSPGIGYLVRQWRLAIELRADHSAIKMLTTNERKDYAALLLNGLRPSGDHAGGKALPCPTAHLTSTRHRSVKMRLTKIMENKPNPRKHRWSAALLIMAFCAGILGFVNTSAIAKEDSAKTAADNVIFVKRVPPKMPANCPGLKLKEIEFAQKQVAISGVMAKHTAIVGSVALKFSVSPEGNTKNIRVVKSNNICFETNAKASVAQWVAEPQGQNVNDVAVLITFALTGDANKNLDSTIRDFIQ